MKHDWQEIELPPGIAKRPRDPRGFPITFVTLIQSDGRPDFTTIDGRQILRCVQEHLCGMCGEPLAGPMAFIGGPLAIEHRNFLDPPMHVECAEYAMRVCPHIAIPTARYAKPKQGEGRQLYQNVHPDRPEKFGLLVTRLCRIASMDGQPVFFAGEPERVAWQDELDMTHGIGG